MSNLWKRLCRSSHSIKLCSPHLTLWEQRDPKAGTPFSNSGQGCSDLSSGKQRSSLGLILIFIQPSPVIIAPPAHSTLPEADKHWLRPKEIFAGLSCSRTGSDKCPGQCPQRATPASGGTLPDVRNSRAQCNILTSDRWNPPALRK